VCRRGGCAEPAVVARAFCLECGVRYLRWHAARDERERRDLAGTGRDPDDALDDEPELARALDLLHELFTP
jgi:hypothetical protein